MDVKPEVFTTDYVGQPGERAFYLQARWGQTVLSFSLEKQQVSVLADKLRELLMMVDAKDTIGGANPARDPALKLQTPVEPEWRIGTMGLAYEEDEDRVVLLAEPADLDEGPGGEIVESDEPALRFLLRRDQVRAFILHASAIVAEGRPTCQLCGLPMDPDGHNCPASNGHRTMA
ncbi:MAG: DUF3090 domain-containing protein [Actinomycetota bacterium]|nr:DUF3090 domain-containing protein [Actinomycetota bacterium]